MRRRSLAGLLSTRTRALLQFDLVRLRTRIRNHWRVAPTEPRRLHFGCGARRVKGWLNVDVVGSEFDIDLTADRLPWNDATFEAFAAQHVVEHLELKHELLPLLKELRRIGRSGAEIWLACPDMERVCRSYLETGGRDILEDRQSRWPDFSLGAMPVQQIVNVTFHQGGEHKNLFDFELLCWALEEAGFAQCERRSEEDFLERFPEFPRRSDDRFSLYVSAAIPSGAAARATGGDTGKRSAAEPLR